MVYQSSFNQYKQESSNSFKINPSEKSHYDLFIKSIASMVKNPILLHLASYTHFTKELPSDIEIDAQLDRGFYSLLFFSQAYLNIIGDKNLLKIAVITTGTQSPLGSEIISPINATLIGPCRITTQEHQSIQFRLIDLNWIDRPQNNINLLQHILHNCVTETWEQMPLQVSYRQGYQWSLSYASFYSTINKQSHLKNNGIYLLTGGLGGVALSCAEAIASTVLKPTFILLSRSDIPANSEWNTILKNSSHPFYSQLQKIQQLQTLGAKCVMFQVDITKYSALKKVIDQCMGNFGAINGLIHTAGISQPELVQFKSKEQTHITLAPKVHGTYNLAKAFNQLPLDFVILTSSLAVLLGGLRQIDYCAANACLDAFADGELFSSANFTISINWNTWRDVGIAARAAKKGEANFLGQGNDISPTEGRALFLDIIQGNEPRIAISKLDLQNQMPPQKLSSPKIKTSRQQINVTTTYTSPMNTVE